MNKLPHLATRLKIGLLGNPNSGKTTLFNRLTGAKQKVGNWPGVTIEKKTGIFVVKDQTIELIDLPGTYSLIKPDLNVAKDEQIANDFILNHPVDLMVNIVDATNLERNLYLTTQLLEMGRSTVVVLNMIDLAKKNQIAIDVERLSQSLGCPVVAISAHKKSGISQLKEILLAEAKHALSPKPIVTYPLILQQQLQQYCQLFVPRPSLNQAIHQVLTENPQNKIQLEAQLGEELDIIIADHRYQTIEAIIRNCITRNRQTTYRFTTWLDKIVLHRVLGIPIFFALMYAMFIFAINVGGAFQDFFDIGSDTLFVQGFSQLLTQAHCPSWLIAILAFGVGKGLNTTITFIPVITGMFFALSFLEGSGYMARAAFVMDRLMRAIGLPGKSFVPMIVGFGCNVPAIMATRTLETERDRILTIIMSPFMSCGARLAIFAVFVAAFFPHGGQNVVFSLYVLGILMAVFTGLLVRKTVLSGEPSYFVMELPPYHWPSLRHLWLQTWQRLKKFLHRAGKFIIPICILLGALNAIPLPKTFFSEPPFKTAPAPTILESIGRAITPIFTPLGIHNDNWPASVGLFTGVLAKEVVVGTLNSLYAQASGLPAQDHSFNVGTGLKTALLSIPENLANLPESFKNPIAASAPAHDMDRNVMGVMVARFHSPIAAYAYLLFVLLYLPCVSTIATILKELNREWLMFAICWNTGLAYGTAVLFYQVMTFANHPLTAIIWAVSLLVALGLVFVWLNKSQAQLKLKPQ